MATSAQLAQFISVTGATDDEAKSLLAASNYDVELAISSYFSRLDEAFASHSRPRGASEASSRLPRGTSGNDEVKTPPPTSQASTSPSISSTPTVSTSSSQQQQQAAAALPAAAAAGVVRPSSSQPTSWGAWIYQLLSSGNQRFWAFLGYPPSSSTSTLSGHTAVGKANAEALAAALASAYPDIIFPPFERSSYSEAVRAAVTRRVPLLVYLHSPRHDDVPVFVRKVLGDEAFVTYVTNNAVCWAGDVSTQESFGLASSLRGASTMPYICLCAPDPRDQGGVRVLVERPGLPRGFATVPSVSREYVDSLIAMMLQLGDHTQAQQAAQEAKQSANATTRNIVREQDLEYARAAEQDRQLLLKMKEEEAKAKEAEKERLQQEAEARRREEEAKQRESQTANAFATRSARLERRRAALAPEPVADNGSSSSSSSSGGGGGGGEGGGAAVTEVGVRLPSGKRLTRRFSVNSSLHDVLDFVESHEQSVAELFQDPLAALATDENKSTSSSSASSSTGVSLEMLDKCDYTKDYVIATQFPRTVLSDLDASLLELKLTRRVMLAVEEAVDEQGVRPARMARQIAIASQSRQGLQDNGGQNQDAGAGT